MINYSAFISDAICFGAEKVAADSSFGAVLLTCCVIITYIIFETMTERRNSFLHISLLVSLAACAVGAADHTILGAGRILMIHSHSIVTQGGEIITALSMPTAISTRQNGIFAG